MAPLNGLNVECEWREWTTIGQSKVHSITELEHLAHLRYLSARVNTRSSGCSGFLAHGERIDLVHHAHAIKQLAEYDVAAVEVRRGIHNHTKVTSVCIRASIRNRQQTWSIVAQFEATLVVREGSAAVFANRCLRGLNTSLIDECVNDAIEGRIGECVRLA